MDSASVIIHSFTVDSRSVANIVGEEVRQVMVYGCGHAKYVEVQDALDRTLSCVDRVFSMELASLAGLERTFEGRVIEVLSPKIDSHSLDGIGSSCKAAITTLLLENYKRQREGFYLIPLIFCVESEETPVAWKLSPHMVTTIDGRSSDGRLYNSLISYKELRRMYKHCAELARSEHFEFRILAEIAKKTFKFVRLELVRDNYHRFVRIPPIWEDACWHAAWNRRLESYPESRIAANQRKQYRWREELWARIQWYHAHPYDPFPAERDRVQALQSRSRLQVLQ